ncbi:MAG: HAD family hydrolase [Candidatus Heimdallarchaeota archaeon]
MDIFFDFHGVLAKLDAVSQNYRRYLSRVLSSVGISCQEALAIHDRAYNLWIEKIKSLRDDFDVNEDSRRFMRQYQNIDEGWERYILNYISPDKREQIKPVLKTSTLEYQALAQGGPILYSDVIPTLETLYAEKGIYLHIASSASSHHVKGGADRHSLGKYIKTFIGYDTVQAPKKAKNPLYFHKMLEITNSTPNSSIFVGDSIDEAINSTKVGMHFVAIHRDGRKPSPEMNIPMMRKIVSNLREIVPIVRAHLNGK